MKKLKKNQLKLDKEVITSLSENDLSRVRGGVNINETQFPVCFPTPTVDPKQCVTVEENCMVSFDFKISCNCRETVDHCQVTVDDCLSSGCPATLFC